MQRKYVLKLGKSIFSKHCGHNLLLVLRPPELDRVGDREECHSCVCSGNLLKLDGGKTKAQAADKTEALLLGLLHGIWEAVDRGICELEVMLGSWRLLGQVLLQCFIVDVHDQRNQIMLCAHRLG